MLIKTPLLHQSSCPRVFLSLSFSLSLRLFFWSAEGLWVHFPAQASKTLLRRHSAPSPHREGNWGLRHQSKPLAGALLAFCVNQGISASFSLLYLLIGWLGTTRFQSTKGPQRKMYSKNKNILWNALWAHYAFIYGLLINKYETLCLISNPKQFHLHTPVN